MLLDEIHRNCEIIARLGHQYGARHMRVFGSVARREERADSDVDILVDFPRGYDLFAQRLPLADKLAELLQRPVELIPEHELNRHIRDQVVQVRIPTELTACSDDHDRSPHWFLTGGVFLS